MPRLHPIYSPEFPYHISARSHNKEWFQLPIEKVWETLSDYLYFINEAYKVEIYSFVLMDNHFHLIARFPENNMAEAMNYFMRESSRRISRDCGRINQVYGNRYFRSLIQKSHYLDHAYKYIYRNPVEAGLCERAEDYPYSTLHILLGKRNGVIPLVADPRLDGPYLERTLKWLNETPEEKDKEEIRKALKRTEFSLTTRSKGNFVHHLEVNSY
jgi:REP element-mobilizing transposase RayT